MMYPTISNIYNKMVGSYVIGNYDGVVSNIEKEDINSVYEKAQQYNKELLEKPTILKEGTSEDENYLSQLKLKDSDGVMGYVQIDKLKIKLPIYHSTSEPVLQRGVGHLEGSSMPIGGEGNHSVLTGHTGLPSAKMFTDLEKIQISDLIVIKVLDKTLTYKVKEIETVLPQEVESLNPVEGEDLITLVTCTPYGVNSHRLLVHAERTENISDNIASTNNTQVGSLFTINSLIIVSLVSILLIVFIYKNRRKNK